MATFKKLYTSTPEVIYSNPGSYILKPQKLYIQVSQIGSTRPEGAEAPSPGHRPGLLRAKTCRPVRAKALGIA